MKLYMFKSQGPPVKAVVLVKFLSQPIYGKIVNYSRHQNPKSEGMPNPICTHKFCLSSMPTYSEKSSLEAGNAQDYRKNCWFSR